MNRIDKCYIYTKEFHCSVKTNNRGCYIFQFGDGELVDSEGDAFFVYCELDSDNKETVQLWYEYQVLTIYSSENPSAYSLLVLTQQDLDEILREFHQIIRLAN